ncbi:MAG: AEC family transporter [Porticoccaceae bacterium]
MDQSILAVIQQALMPSAFVILLGVIWRHTEPGGISFLDVRRTIGILVLNLFYPALIIAVIPSVVLSFELISSPLLFNAGILAGMGLCLLLKPYLTRIGMGKPELAVLILACAYANIISLGVPLLRAEQGEAATRFAIYVDVLAISPMLWIVGVWIASRWSTADNGDGSLRSFLKTFLSLPPIWAFVFAVFLNLSNIELPQFIQTSVRMLGDTTMHAMLLAVGMSLSFASIARYWRISLLASVIKLALVPGVVFGLGLVTLGNGEVMKSTVLLAATPTMMATLVLSERFGLNTELLATILVTSTALFFVSLPAWLWLL